MNEKITIGYIDTCNKELEYLRWRLKIAVKTDNWFEEQKYKELCEEMNDKIRKMREWIDKQGDCHE